MTRAAPATLAPPASAASRRSGSEEHRRHADALGAGELVVGAVADEEAVGRLDVERSRRAQVDLGLRLHEAAVRRERLRRRRGPPARSAARRPAPPPSRPRSAPSLTPRRRELAERLASRPAAGAATAAARTRGAPPPGLDPARRGTPSAGRHRRAAPSARRGSSPTSAASNSSAATADERRDRARCSAPPRRPATRRACPRGRRSPRALAQHLPGDRGRRPRSCAPLPIASRITLSPAQPRRARRRSARLGRASRELVVVGARVPEADGREVPRRRDLPAGLGPHPLLEQRREAHVLADQRLKPVAAVAAQHRPELQRAEAPAERRAVVAKVERALGTPRCTSPARRTPCGTPRAGASRASSSRPA